MNKTTEPAAPDLSRIEPIDYVYRGSDGLIYRTVPQHVPVIETIPRYSASTVERLARERDANTAYFEAYHQLRVAVNAAYPQDPYQLAEDVPALMQQQLAAMTQERETLSVALEYEAAQLAASQAREQQLREALENALPELGYGYDAAMCTSAFVSISETIASVKSAISLPQDDTALREQNAKLLRKMAMEIDLGTQETEDAAITLCRKAAELREGKK